MFCGIVCSVSLRNLRNRTNEEQKKSLLCQEVGADEKDLTVMFLRNGIKFNKPTTHLLYLWMWRSLFKEHSKIRDAWLVRKQNAKVPVPDLEIHPTFFSFHVLDEASRSFSQLFILKSLSPVIQLFVRKDKVIRLIRYNVCFTKCNFPF